MENYGKFFSHLNNNGQLIFDQKVQYKLAAEQSEAGSYSLPFRKWCPGWDSNPHGENSTTF